MALYYQSSIPQYTKYLFFTFHQQDLLARQKVVKQELYLLEAAQKLDAANKRVKQLELEQQQLTSVSGYFKCSICLSAAGDGSKLLSVTTCGHVFCEGCLIECLKISKVSVFNLVALTRLFNPT